MMLLSGILKSAMQTYSYTESAKRDYTPPKPTIRPSLVKIDTGVEEKKTSIPKGEEDDLPKDSPNKYWDPNGYPTWRFTHPFTPTISGTGGGPQYWTNTRNPYED